MNAPFLELGFYFDSLSGVCAFRKLSEWLISRGHRAESALVARYSRSKTGFNSYDDVDPRQLSSNDELRELFDADQPLLQIFFRGASDIIPGSNEAILAQVSISKEAAKIDSCPIAIWFDGSLFGGPPAVEIPGSRAAGCRAFQCFHDAVEDVLPSYGSITVDYGLECPTDLRTDPRSYAFRDFYVSRKFIGTENIENIKSLAIGAYIDESDHGLIVCSYKLFAPRIITISDLDAQKLSTAVAHIIANRAIPPQ